MGNKTDFSKTNIHCSSIYNIMGGKVDKKTNLDWYNDFLYKHTESQLRYDAVPVDKRHLKKHQDLYTRIQTYHAKVLEYESVKNEDPLSVGCKSHLKKVYAYAKYGKWAASKDKGTK
jgi:hypothetical protein